MGPEALLVIAGLWMFFFLPLEAPMMSLWIKQNPAGSPFAPMHPTGKKPSTADCAFGCAVVTPALAWCHRHQKGNTEGVPAQQPHIPSVLSGCVQLMWPPPQRKISAENLRPQVWARPASIFKGCH